MNLYELPVHPLAAAIPMSSNDDIQNLADRMKEHGQRVPVKIAEIDGVMMLIDGRHRLAAAKLIDLELTHEVINGSDVFINEYIFDLTFMSKKPNISQQAMWEAMANPEGKQGERDNATSHLKVRSELSRGSLRRARFVLKHSSFLTGEVLNGTIKVTAAYETAKAEKATQEFLKERTKVLQDESPEHAERVANGEDLNKRDYIPQYIRLGRYISHLVIQ